ncbi:MAG TPA: AmmeMemoRadiSam system protein B [Bryobacteraceae bacterium]|nr:AmmeMemoRadiSam system protein B [Bryobacteraceae bacterium]
MPSRLPRLRTNLDFMPSPVADRPGLLIRDSYQYSDVTLIVPPILVQCLPFFDGEQSDLDLRQALVQLTGEIRIGDVQDQLVEALSKAGFLENEVYFRLRDEKHREFAEAGVREATHQGSAYPEDPGELRQVLLRYLEDGKPAPAPGTLIGIAAPHVSPEGGWPTYQAAYHTLREEYRDRTFVILGTSHYGAPDRFGLTRKPFVTPLGQARTDTVLVDRIAAEAPESVLMEDYCHAVEHSIEFQVVFLQYLFGPDVCILPILCGSFAKSIYEGGRPEDTEEVRRFLGVLGDIAAREGDRLFWVLGIDLAHMGRRYGDRFEAQAGHGEMLTVEQRDKERIERVKEGDAAGFWDRVQHQQDDLKWCGSSPLYTLLKAVPQARADLLRYQQWNIDEQSVVSFAALAFRR